MCNDVLMKQMPYTINPLGSYLSVNDGRRGSVVTALDLRRRTPPVLFPPNDLAFCVVPAS